VIRIGLMGCGMIAQTAHLWAIAHAKGVQLVSAFDPDPQRLRELRKAAPQIDIQPYTDIDDFFKSPIDAVSITSPAPAHYQNVLDAARFGKHALCEKPLAMTERDGLAMIAAMAKAKKQLFVGLCYRFSPAALKIKELVENHAIGEVRSVRLVYIWDLHGRYTKLPDGRSVESAHYVGRMLEGGPMVDCGVHQIDLARFWLGSEVVRSRASGAWVADYQAPDHMWLHLDHANGCHTTVEISYSYAHTARDVDPHFTYELIGTEGVIRYDRENRQLVVRNSQGTTHYPWADEKNFQGMYEAFVRAVESGDPGYLATAQDGLASMQISRAATEAVIADRLVLQRPTALLGRRSDSPVNGQMQTEHLRRANLRSDTPIIEPQTGDSPRDYSPN
jgi:predicted dehydrogenase